MAKVVNIPENPAANFPTLDQTPSVNDSKVLGELASVTDSIFSTSAEINLPDVSWNLEVVWEGNGTVGPSPTGINFSTRYVEGKTVNLQATAYSGSRFVGWAEGSDGVTISNGTRNVVMDSDKKVIAVFALLEDLDDDLSGGVDGENPPPPDETKGISGYRCNFGLDNVRLGLSTYRSIGTYVSPPLENIDIGQLALKVTEKRPYLDATANAVFYSGETYDQSDDIYFLGSIEYWVIKRDRDTNRNIIKDSKFSILPFGIERVNHERLILNAYSNAGLLQYDVGTTCNFTNYSQGDIKVYRNGVELVDDADWFDVTEDADILPCNNIPMNFKIKINNPSVREIYTVSYNSLGSTGRFFASEISAFNDSGLNVVDLIGDGSVRRLTSQIVVIDGERQDSAVNSSEYYLMILIRNNGSRDTVSSSVEDYLLVGGSNDLSKFEV